MRTETTTRTLYKFDELSERAQDRAIDKVSLSQPHDEWWDSTYEDAKNVGITITGFDLGRAQTIEGKVADTEGTAHAIVKDHGNMCETYKTAQAYLKDRDAVIEAARKDENGEWLDENELDANLDQLGDEFTRSILEDYRIILSKEYDYLTSREAILETIEANDYEFTEDGELA